MVNGSIKFNEMQDMNTGMELLAVDYSSKYKKSNMELIGIITLLILNIQILISK